MNENTELVQVKKAAELALANGAVERHSLYQLQCYVLAKEPTIQGKLHRCLLEIKPRKLSLEALELEIEDQEDQIQLIDFDIAQINGSQEDERRKFFKIRALERRRKSIQNSLDELKNKQNNIKEELMFFCSAFDQLNRREKIKSWDDPEVQMNYWNEKLRQEVNVRLLLGQLPDVELMKTVLCLHDDSQLKKSVVKMLQDARQRSTNLAVNQEQNQ